jgi:hypothetical protein
MLTFLGKLNADIPPFSNKKKVVLSFACSPLAGYYETLVHVHQGTMQSRD